MADLFGDRMKKYEAVSDIRLTERIPIIVRFDGNSFSNLTKTKKLEKPYDSRFCEAMQAAAKSALDYCSGAQVAYVQSDEITVLLRNDMNLNTTSFLGNRLTKLCSLLASKVSVTFSAELSKRMEEDIQAIFDCRVFLVPESEVNNAFLWRQEDCFKNCVSSVAYWGLRDKYGRKKAQKMLDKLNGNQRQELIFRELGINMNDYPTKYKRGVCISKNTYDIPIENIVGEEKAAELGKSGEIVKRGIWEPDNEIPRFTDTSYLGKFMKKTIDA